MMSRLSVTMKLGRDNFYWASLEILSMSWMGPRKLWMKKLLQRERQLLLGKFRNLEHELDGAKEALDEEA